MTTIREVPTQCNGGLESCYVSLQVHMLKPNPQCDGISRWGLCEVAPSGREDGAFMNRISALTEEPSESASVPSTM